MDDLALAAAVITATGVAIAGVVKLVVRAPAVPPAPKTPRKPESIRPALVEYATRAEVIDLTTTITDRIGDVEQTHKEAFEKLEGKVDDNAEKTHGAVVDMTRAIGRLEGAITRKHSSLKETR